jgi:hypothetical protein
MDKTTGIISLQSICSSSSEFSGSRNSKAAPREFRLTSTHGAYTNPKGWKSNNVSLATGTNGQVIFWKYVHTLLANVDPCRMHFLSQTSYILDVYTQETFEMLSSHKWTIVTTKASHVYASRLRKLLTDKQRAVDIISPAGDIAEDTECVVFLIDPFPHSKSIAQQVSSATSIMYTIACSSTQTLQIISKGINQVFIEENQLWNVRCGSDTLNFLQMNGVLTKVGKLALTL